MLKKPANAFRALPRSQQNMVLLKKNAILLLSLISSIFLLVGSMIKGVWWVLQFILLRVVRVGIRFFALPMYQLFKNMQLKTQKFGQFTRAQFGENFSRNMIVYGGLIVLSVFTATTNLKARELRPEDVGTNTLLFALLANQNDFELITEAGTIETPDALLEGNIEPPRQLAHVGVQSVTSPTGAAIDEDANSSLTQSGDALIRPDITGTDITPQARDKIITYVVLEGDTISEIADTFNINTSTILWENKIGPRDFIKPGQELVILPVSGVSYTIAKDDTLTGIAARYRSQSEHILEVNKLADASELRIGAKIIIPDGIPPTPVAPAASSSSALADLRDLFKPAKAIAGKFNWPTNSKHITQYFRGWRHTGIDVGVRNGNPIYAAEDGIITTSGWNAGGYGYYIIVDHGNGITTLYAHNSKLLVKKGERIAKGEIIAQSGSTGRSTGPHLHFEVRINGNRVNPLDYL